MEESSGLSSMKFFSDQHLSYADSLRPHEARARIEVSVLNLLRILNSPDPAISDLSLINRKRSNSCINQGILTDVSYIFLSTSFTKSSLMNAKTAKAFVRVWKVMEICFQILLQEKRVTQRELFYKLLCDSPDYFSSQIEVNRTVQDVVALLRCSRYSLGIMASSRGLVAGRLFLQEPGKEAVDCSACGSSGFAITGDLNLLDNTIMRSDARYIIVVEKHAIFHRLVEDRVFNHIPCVFITAKGYPDIATRFFLHRMSTTFPDLPILALVDWNPAGLAILCTFKFGSIGMGLEAYRYACNVKWIGLRGDDLDLIPEESLVPLKPKDSQIAKSLLSSKILQDTYRDELSLMVRTGKRAEIEALYCHGYNYLGKYIATKIVQGKYI
ncbi:Spo11/DNA topoisomerase VI subunit A N-terminal [Arabidopsis thaliana x Arabidopsis arenosa]|uniref:Meiotic recombination protein SPO11-2 n=1 Tax=Arabidopsis thaliana x Arabidopsis arenosa TaxID=1240361 RepID=A0A8T2BBW8_9BRAS|nr:Spo11/DNA topoisomerase VI subunit A N-terminal [Arabidopsis thaliana x Arabidopsis arenosa]